MGYSQGHSHLDPQLSKRHQGCQIFPLGINVSGPPRPFRNGMFSNHDMGSFQKVVTHMPALQDKIEGTKCIFPKPCDASGPHLHINDGVGSMGISSPDHTDPGAKGRTAQAHFYKATFERLVCVDLLKHGLCMEDGYSLMRMVASHYDAGYVVERYVLPLIILIQYMLANTHGAARLGPSLRRYANKTSFMFGCLTIMRRQMDRSESRLYTREPTLRELWGSLMDEALKQMRFEPSAPLPTNSLLATSQLPHSLLIDIPRLPHGRLTI